MRVNIVFKSVSNLANRWQRYLICEVHINVSIKSCAIIKALPLLSHGLTNHACSGLQALKDPVCKIWGHLVVRIPITALVGNSRSSHLN